MAKKAKKAKKCCGACKESPKKQEPKQDTIPLGLSLDEVARLIKEKSIKVQSEDGKTFQIHVPPIEDMDIDDEPLIDSVVDAAEDLRDEFEELIEEHEDKAADAEEEEDDDEDIDDLDDDEDDEIDVGEGD